MTDAAVGTNAPDHPYDLGSADSSHKRKSRWVIWTIVLIVFLIGIWLLVRAFEKPKPKQPPQPIPVGAATVTLGNIDVYLDARAARSAPISQELALNFIAQHVLGLPSHR